jgi:hypothetical protein
MSRSVPANSRSAKIPVVNWDTAPMKGVDFNSLNADITLK